MGKYIHDFDKAWYGLYIEEDNMWKTGFAFNGSTQSCAHQCLPLGEEGAPELQ